MSSVADKEAKRILIVDDSRAIQAIIRRALECEELGALQFQTACDGAEALDKVRAFKPDLVLSDWHMPGVSGIEMLQTLRQTGHGDVAVGFVTTETAADCVTEARSNGALFVLNKPFDDRELRQAVAQGLGGRPTPTTTTRTRVADSVPAGQAPAIESLALLQQALFAHLGMRGFDLTRHEGHEAYVQQTPQLIALYGSAGRKGVYSVGLLDFNACWLIGGLAAGCSPEEMQAAREQGRPSAKQIDHASRFMRTITPLLRKRTPADAPALSAARLTSQPFDKLDSLLEKNNGRSDFQLRLPALGAEGRISFLLA
jgi:CheY-like chemotaxis protein